MIPLRQLVSKAIVGSAAATFLALAGNAGISPAHAQAGDAEKAYNETKALGTCGGYRAYVKSFTNTSYARDAQDYLEKNCGEPRPATPPPSADTSADAASIYRQALDYEQGRNGKTKDLARAAELFRQAAEKGHVRAMSDLGFALANARGVERDFNESNRWYRRAAARGNSRAMNNLGFAYERGRGVEKDFAEAVRWYRRGAEAGSLVAANNLGKAYANGRGVTKDFREAFKWYLQAAEKGYQPAFFPVAFAYSNGRGVTKNDVQAVRWYRKSAEAGNGGAMTNLAIRYDEGRGVERNFGTAAGWLLRAVRAGNNRLSRDKGKGWNRNTLREVQRRLRSAGYFNGPIDGRIGRQTLAALDDYRNRSPNARPPRRTAPPSNNVGGGPTSRPRPRPRNSVGGGPS